MTLAVGMLLAASPACRGSSQHTADSNVLGRAFQAKALAVCAGALAEKKAEPPFPYPNFNPTQPDPSKLAGIGQYEKRGVAIFQTWLRKMTALGTPPRGRGQWDAVLETLRHHTQIIADQQAAALRGDTSTFTNDYQAGNAAQDQMVKAADAAGIPICATAAGA